MEDSLECPVCLIKIRPEQLKSYGICYPYGHTTCATCCESWLETNDNCPICREKGFSLQSHNVLVNKIFKMLSDQTMYDCKNCPNQFPGNILSIHESMCNGKYHTCPMCLKRCTYESLLDNSHGCFFKQVLYNPEDKDWNFILDLKNPDLTPILLTNVNKTSYICVVFKKATFGVKVFVYWLNREALSPVQNSLVHVHIQVATNGGGPLGRLMKRRFNFIPNKKEPSPNTILLNKWVESWIKYTESFQCKCGYASPHAKITIKVQSEFSNPPAPKLIYKNHWNRMF